MGVLRRLQKPQKEAHTTSGHLNLETELAQWANSGHLFLLFRTQCPMMVFLQNVN